MRTALLVALLVGCACSTTTMGDPPCGCFDAKSACAAGDTDLACGLDGLSCRSCTSSQRCVSGACQTFDAGPPALAPWQQELLTAHNSARANAIPAPSPPLSALTWDDASATVAAAWAANCTFEHNKNRGDRGENLFASTNETAPTAVVRSWVSEAASYTYATNSCVGACGHYTQVVWRDTTQVGCASHECTTNSPFGGGTWFLWVCDYAPPGNYVGEKPY